MSNMLSTEHNPGDAGIDLSQFYQVFFEEAAENLDNMEQALLELDVHAADDEELNAIFRCAHSIKGGAATFGFMEVADLTHKMETLLDQLRRHELQATPPMVNTLLAAGDALRAQLALRQGDGGEEVDTGDLLAQIHAFSTGESAPAQASVSQEIESSAPSSGQEAPSPEQEAAQPEPAATQPATNPDAGGKQQRVLELIIDGAAKPAAIAGVVDLFKDIPGLGEIEPLENSDAPDAARQFRIRTTSSDDELLDLLSFHIDRATTQLRPVQTTPTADQPTGDDTERYGFFPDAPGVPAAARTNGTVAKKAPAQPGAAARAHTRPAASLRVPVDKIDQLINLVGELVITQAMLAQTGAGLDEAQHESMLSGLAELERNTRDLQESVMSIRMIPMSVVFNRFPRMLHDLAGKLDKQVELVTEGEATELDKGMVEKITDPLTHLVRNSCDHGIELPAERRAKGKPEQGRITLTASHQGGNIIIEVRDDGRGLNREKLLENARSKGIDAPDSLTDSEVWNLIFAPGFSTAEHVTDVSGRGVGMDVVKKNILALGGSVDVDSVEGMGMSVKVRLPLTLAIMESMSVAVGGECYVLPLSAVIEAFQPTSDQLKTVGGNARLVQVRGDYLPVVDLADLMRVPVSTVAAGEGSLMVVVESEARRIALVVDELLGQQQVVVKNLEANFRRVDHVSGATIMGDGRVALILDTGSLVRRTRH